MKEIRAKIAAPRIITNKFSRNVKGNCQSGKTIYSLLLDSICIYFVEKNIFLLFNQYFYLEFSKIKL